MKTILLFMVCALSTLVAHPCKNYAAMLTRNPHSFSFGPEVVALDINTNINNINIQGNKCFYGLRLAYEYVRPQAFYAGAELFSTFGSQNFDVTRNGLPLSQDNDDSAFAGTEFRFGYTFAEPRWLVSPFLGFGSYVIGSLSDDNNFQEGIPYLVGGARIKYIITPSQTINLNLKIFGGANYKSFEDSSSRTSRVHKGLWGGEIALPYVWVFSCNQKWDLQVEPYFLKLNFSELQNAYGLKLLIGYRF